MIQNKRAFSLVEVVVATTILSMSVFWIYRLIWENSKILTHSSNYTQANMLFRSIEECIDNIGITVFSGSNIQNYKFNFWSDMNWCFVWELDPVILDNIEYELSWTITNSWYVLWNKYIDWELEIYNDNVWELQNTYRQTKRQE